MLDLLPMLSLTLLHIVVGETGDGYLLFFFFFSLTVIQGPALSSLQLSKRASILEICLGVEEDIISRILLIFLGDTQVLLLKFDS